MIRTHKFPVGEGELRSRIRETGIGTGVRNTCWSRPKHPRELDPARDQILNYRSSNPRCRQHRSCKKPGMVYTDNATRKSRFR